MEDTLKSVSLRGSLVWALGLSVAVLFVAVGQGREEPIKGPGQERGELRLRKTVKTREYQGRSVEGEERVVGPGDSLWRMLIQEKGLSEKRFHRYLILIGSLNPHLKKPDILQVGDTIFIPIRPDEILGIQVSSGKGETKVYRVKQGDYIYKLLREQFGFQEKKGIQSAFSQVKQLNPRKKNWDLLLVGEAILFPGLVQPPKVAALEAQKPLEVVGLDYAQKLPAEENLHLLEQVIRALGNETDRGGEEVLTLQGGTIRIDRGAYPVIHNPRVEQKVILDLGGKIPPQLRTRLEAQNPAPSIVSVKKGASLHETVNSLLSRLGFQSLPSNRPVVMQDRGVGFQIKGEWMVTAPESSGRQEVFVISLSDIPSRTPDYLKDYLSFQGMNLKEILLPSSSLSPVSLSLGIKGQVTGDQIETWPREKRALVDAFLKSYSISFAADRQLSLSLREGIRLDTRIDRLFELGGKKYGIFFQAAGDEVKRFLEEREGLKSIELDLAALSSRELISRLLLGVGEKAAYQEHRFPAVEGGAKERLVLTVFGFFLPQRSLLLTDHEIPKDLLRFFSDRGLRVVYFW